MKVRGKGRRVRRVTEGRLDPGVRVERTVVCGDTHHGTHFAVINTHVGLDGHTEIGVITCGEGASSLYTLLEEGQWRGIGRPKIIVVELCMSEARMSSVQCRRKRSSPCCPRDKQLLLVCR